MDLPPPAAQVVTVETRTASGQLVTVECTAELAEPVRQLLAQVHRIRGAENRPLGVDGHPRWSRYHVTQLRRIENALMTLEALEVLDPPDGRNGLILFERRTGGGGTFWEFASREGLLVTWESWSGCLPERRPPARDMVRCVQCNTIAPWFCAIGDQPLHGDWVLPDEGIVADPLFVTGRRFVLRDREGLPTIKRCLCVQRLPDPDRRIVTWDDGSQWDETIGRMPRPLDEAELWIDDAVQKFRELLAGRRRSFDIIFGDGTRFSGRLVGETNGCSVDGLYRARIRLRNRRTLVERTHTGDVVFTATTTIPTIEHYLTARASLENEELLEIEECVRVNRRGERGWAGVYRRTGNWTD